MVSSFPVPSRDVTYQSFPGAAGNTLITVFPARESLFSDIPAGDGKTANLFTVYHLGGELIE
jgi:hypothetical protein